MSGIIGLINFNNEPILIEQPEVLLAGFQNFPADSIDIWQKENVFLGCHAQWITPESIGEKLPYYDYERKLAITADAIIDNRKELFEKLHVNDSYVKRTITDSQLIMLAYDKWGEDCPKHLIGDFAFMIWDEKEQKLFGARDFSGTRTLYFVNDYYRFAFSTIIEPLLNLPTIKKSLNEEWLAEFLAIPGMFEAANMNNTVYKSINQLAPSHSITVQDGKVATKKYEVIFENERIRLKSNEEYEEAFREVFQKAVTARLRSQGQIGSQLSGGLDSGTVVSFAAGALKKNNRRLHTYSYVPIQDFVDWTPNEYIPNETPFIEETVKHVGNINSKYMSLEGKNPYDEIDDMLDIMEMPYKFFENSFWLKGIYKTASNEGMKILLNGARGNHSISWGSWSMTYDYYALLLKRLKLIRLYKELDIYCVNERTGKKVMLPFLIKRILPFYSNNYLNSLQQNSFPKLINPDFAKRSQVYGRLKHYEIDTTGITNDDPSIARRNHFKNPYTWNKSGTAGTKLSLKYSLWERDPSNDLRVIRFCLAIPEEQYTCSGLERSLIRRATTNNLPDKVRLNQRSRGIQGADVIQRMSSSWGFFIDELQEMTKDNIMADFLNMKVIENALKKIKNGPKPELLFDYDFKILTRSLVLFRFIKRLTN